MEKLIEIVAEILNVDKANISPETSRDDIPAWDSFNHIRLIAEAEDQLDAKIPFEKISEIRKVSDFLNYVKRK
ncbi:MAG: Acyl carrier protein [bacterium ADurb.Bin363]|nr:MAG: Acyl carrier protein [bacterium ADurb.Bin363]